MTERRSLFGRGQIDMSRRVTRFAACLTIVTLPLLSACAGMEQTFRDANGVVNEVIDLSAETKDPAMKAPLYAIEDRVTAACRPIFESANRQMVQGEVPLSTRVSALASSPACRQTVSRAQRELDRYRGETDAESRVTDAEIPATF